MQIDQRNHWDFHEFLTLSDQHQKEAIRNWFEENDSLNSVVQTDAFLKEQSKSNGELFDVDAFSIESIHAEPDSRKIRVLFDYSASAYEERHERGGKLPIRGRATLVIHEDGSEHYESVEAKVIGPEENSVPSCSR